MTDRRPDEGVAAAPAGVRVELDAYTRRIAGGRLLGGSPRRLLRLSAAGERALAELSDGRAISLPARKLARTLLAGGLAHPIPDRADAANRVTIVVPARDRAAQLERCLAALDGAEPVIVIDDGSVESDALATIVRSADACLIRRPFAGGPAAARNSALEAVTTDLVAFLDSDCVAPDGWLTALVGHFDDPLVAAVAPRIRPLAAPRAGTGVAAYAIARSPLDMGARPARVAPGGRVAYVPSAALIVRVSALGDGFDAELRHGEDVDLVWRLCDAGLEVRYDPRVIVEHEEPLTLAGLLRRRFAYGTSAGPLARRHPARLAPAIAHPATALAALLALAGKRAAAATLLAAQASSMLRRATRLGLPRASALRLSGESSLRSALSLARWASTVGLPLTALLARRRPLLLTLLAAPALGGRDRRESRLPAPAWIVFAFVDDCAYAAGVWRGCLNARTLRPLLPALRGAARDDRARPDDIIDPVQGPSREPRGAGRLATGEALDTAAVASTPRGVA